VKQRVSVRSSDAGAAVVALAFWFVCSTLSAAPLPGAPSFRNDVLPVLTKSGCNSGPCHGALAGKNGFKLSLRGYDPDADYRALTRIALGRRVVKTAPAHSLILLKPTSTIPHGGGRRFRVGSPQYQIIADWIASGAPAPRSDDPVIETLRVIPDRVLVEKPGEELQLLVKARYSDGEERDVTRWTKFTSTNDGVATVDEAGSVTTRGHGEGAISIWYASKVAFSMVTVPYPRTLDSDAFEVLSSDGLIDRGIQGKLRQLKISPSSLCDDSTYIRRLYLDTLGVLPTVEELVLFLSDSRKDKRARLVEEVLKRPEYVDYWSYKWSDLLLVSSRKLQRSAMWSYYEWIRQSVRENKPWDVFISELVTASGNTLTNGAANYWVLHKQPIEISENISQAFLGISLTCARCHNHPLEKWTQNQYYGMANLVSRVGVKTGNLPGEFTVISRHMGDVNHPRLGTPMLPQPLDGEALSLGTSKDRRQHLAEWLTQNRHFARTVVNRVWDNFLGRGLVHPVDDLRATNPASNEELFTALTEDFVARGFDVKALIREIVNSAAYQLSAETNDSNADDDKYYSHHLSRRLPAEVVLDVISQVTGVPEEFEGYSLGTRAFQLPDTQIESYFLDSFGRPERLTGAANERKRSSNVAQALHLINGETLNRKLRRRGNEIGKLLEKQSSTRDLVRSAYRIALTREPTSAEIGSLQASLGEVLDRQGVEDLFWAILTSKEFLFTH